MSDSLTMGGPQMIRTAGRDHSYAPVLLPEARHR